MRINITLWLIVINVIIFIFQVIAAGSNFDLIKTPGCTPNDIGWGPGCDGLSDLLALNTKILIEGGYIWQIFTYMFTHGGFAHIFLNMFALLMFGHRVELEMGPRKFLTFYILCGIGSALLFMTITGISNSPMLGASGAIFGVLTAFGIMFPRATVFVMGYIPMPAIFAVILFGGIELFFGVTGFEPGIANFGHLGGMITGFILLKFFGFQRRKVRFYWE